MHAFEGWESFYVIVGTSAGALVGLQFIVMTLMAQRPATYATDVGAAFSTPTIVHFCSVLLISALVRAPWPSPLLGLIVLGSLGVVGVMYTLLVTWRVCRQTAYAPQLEDWLFHSVLPFLAYLGLACSPFISRHAEAPLFAVAGVALALLFIAVHNTWDTIEYQITVNLRDRPQEEPLQAKPVKPARKITA